MLACFAEAPFTLILIVVTANSVIGLPQSLQLLAIVLYAIISVFPMIVLRIAVRRGQTVVDIQKWRLKNKNFVRIVSGAGFAILAAFLLVFKILGA